MMFLVSVRCGGVTVVYGSTVIETMIMSLHEVPVSFDESVSEPMSV